MPVTTLDESKPRVAGKMIPKDADRRKLQREKKKNYVKEEDPHYLPPGWEDDLVEAIFRFPECEGAEYSATTFGFKWFAKDGERVMLPKKVIEEINRSCKICKRSKVQRDPKTPSRWVKTQEGKKRCYFEPVTMNW